MSIASVEQRIGFASGKVGAGREFTGRCEAFVRSCFGFPARYASARLAFEATTRRHPEMAAPAGVPVFWDILAGPNVNADHIALSVGGGFCISTSAGRNRTVAKVSIDDLTRRWGMRYRGWSEDYHGVVVHAGSHGMASAEEQVVTMSPDAWPMRDLPVAGNHTPSSLRAWRTLMASIGFTDDDLDLAMQRWLRRRGFYAEHLLLDGDFAVESVKALQQFLAGQGLYPFGIDGDRGPDTVQGEIRYLNQQRRFLV